MATEQKLTKKQKKSLAFRERKQKSGSRNVQDDNDVPVPEDQDLAGLQADYLEIEAQVGGDKGQNKASNGKEKSKSKAEQGDKAGEVAEKPKKRKRIPNDEANEDVETGGNALEKPKQKKRRGVNQESTLSGEQIDGSGHDGDGKNQLKQRFILFVGNLKYTTSLEAIKDHFAACDPPPTIRLLTPKPSAQKPNSTITKSKGCAFLEFRHRNALQQGLKLHQSELDGRRINVELTAGGGGKSDNRLTKLRERNKGLDDQRKKRKEKDPLEQNPHIESGVQRPQRYSTTSGVEQTHAGKRTWTVGDTEEAERHRGGRKHAKKGRPKAKDWGTGMNAIPVG